MRRSVLGVFLGIVLATVAGGGIAVARTPVPPEITGVAVTWGLYEWDDGVTHCTLIADATLDPGVTKGRLIYATATAHVKWVGPGGGTWWDFDYWTVRVPRGDTTVQTYTWFDGDGGYYVVDRVRFDLVTWRGTVIDTFEVSTANTCMNG